jgi:hypothetical protein
MGRPGVIEGYFVALSTNPAYRTNRQGSDPRLSSEEKPPKSIADPEEDEDHDRDHDRDQAHHRQEL